MKPLSSLVFAAAVIVPAAHSAASSLDGTWKADLKTAKFGGKPELVMLKDGIYECGSCVPPNKFPADGKPHEVTNPYYDTSTATVIPPRELDVSHSKGGKVVFTETITVSDDGNTAIFKGSDSTATTGAPVVFNYTTKRVGKLAAGAAAVSGTWLMTGATDSDNALLVTYKVAGDMLSMSSPTGQSYTAKINGPQAPYVGDPGTSTVAIKKVGKSTYKETDYRAGKVIYVVTTTPSADGKTAKIAAENPENGETMNFTAIKQ